MENQNFPRFGTPNRKGSDPVIYYYAHNSGLQNQSVLYYHVGSLDAERKCLLDPNGLSEDGTTSAKGYYFSDNGKYLCYGLSKAGSDWREFHVKVQLLRFAVFSLDFVILHFTHWYWVSSGSTDGKETGRRVDVVQVYWNLLEYVDDVLCTVC